MARFTTTDQPTSPGIAAERRKGSYAPRHLDRPGWNEANISVVIGFLIGIGIPICTIAAIAYGALSIMAALAEWTR